MIPSILKKNFWTHFKEWGLVTLGVVIYVSGWVIFLTPNNLVGGGVTGISSIIQYATGGAIQMGYTYFVLNVILLVIAFFILGKGFGAKTIYAIILGSIGLRLMPLIPGIEVIRDQLALANGKLMSTIMGGIMAGTGIGMSISQGGSTGGTDIIALIYTKFRNVSPGKVILFIDVVIIGSSFFVPSYVTVDGVDTLLPWQEKVVTVVYGFILVAICSSVMDMYLNGSRQSVQVFILSRRYVEIADAITREMHRGVTVLDGRGWYTHSSSEILMVITRKTDLSLLLRYVKTIDPDAFLSVSSVTGVYGKGFDTIKGDTLHKEEK